MSIALLALLLLFAAACGKRRPAVTVNGQVITAREVQARAGIMELVGFPYESESRAAEEMADQLLLRQEAKRRNVEPTADEVDKYAEQIENELKSLLGGETQMWMLLSRHNAKRSDLRRLALDRMAVWKVGRAIFNEMSASDSEVEAYWSEHSADFETVKASHILFAAEDEAKAREVAAEARKPGVDFGELAAKYTIEPNGAERKGELSEATRGSWVKPFEEAAFALEPGQVSDPVQTQFGWHVIKVHEHKRPKLSDVRDQVAGLVKQEKTEKALEDLVKSLRAGATITYAEGFKPE